MRLKFIIILLLVVQYIHAQKQWVMEAEDPNSSVSWDKDGVADIFAPKGITLWNTSLMQGDVTIDYEARIIVDESKPISTVNNPQNPNRLSDLNCFWLASDPTTKDGSVFKNMKQRKGVFVNQYALQLYYMGYGGNNNSTTRFRRYDGNKAGITDATMRPGILREYTDKDNLLKPNHWYRIHIEQRGDRVTYSIDGKRIVDYIDITPLKKGYFGFRTTLAHAQLRNFSYSCSNPDTKPITLRWVKGKGGAVTFGVPFAQGELAQNAPMNLSTDKGGAIAHDSWTLASWPDGSVKWKAIAAVVPQDADSCLLDIHPASKKKDSPRKTVSNGKQNEASTKGQITAGNSTIFFSENSENVIDSIVTNGIKTSGASWLEYNSRRLKATHKEIEQQGNIRTTLRVDGECFTLRIYAYRGSDEIKVVHTLLIDSAMNKDGIRSLGFRTSVPMRDADHKRGIVFDNQYMHVKPLIARRPIKLNEDGEPDDTRSKTMVDAIASWDGFRLSQLSPNGFSIRKRATAQSPWIGTMEGHRSAGRIAIGDNQSSINFSLEDFWQSYPSTLQVDNARSDNATVSLWLWSPEAEPMCFEHYDTVAHTLEAAYEDIQEGMSTAYGIARTSTFYITPTLSPITDQLHMESANMSHAVLMPVPEYLHRKRAFGVWSLPSGSSLDSTLTRIADFYRTEIERNYWYGYFNYGDVMHTYDGSRGEWRYDVGGYAWDNTELATNAMLWYSFLRTGDSDLWRMAEAMARHNGEVDCYHQGPHTGLGTRHNVLHWGCGAKEARISQAYWNRFLYYLTADERSGDLMREVRDADTLLYHLDPMRLAQPRSDRYPCTTPARLRIGPDWLAYAGNWFAEWERTGNNYYYDKIKAGMKSISALPHGIFSGPKALGYDPATGIISWEGDASVQNTNHLLPIMGGFEMMNEMLFSINNKEWFSTWLDLNKNYKEKALEISRNNFRIPRLKGYAYWHTGKEEYRNTAVKDLLSGNPFRSSDFFYTNDAATWGLDAIFLQEVLK